MRIDQINKKKLTVMGRLMCCLLYVAFVGVLTRPASQQLFPTEAVLLY